MSRAQKMFAAPKPTPIASDMKNKDGFAAFSVDLYEQYTQMVMVNTIGNTYYMSQKELFNLSTDLHSRMKDQDPGFMAKAIVYARNEGLMRLQPIMGLAYLSLCPEKVHFRYAFNKVIKTPGDLVDFAAILGSIRKGRGFGHSIKSAVNTWLTVGDSGSGLSQYHAIKYGGGKGEDRWALRDIVKVTHPEPKNALQSALFKYLTKGENSPDLNQVSSIEALKRVAQSRKEYSEQDFTHIVNDLIDTGKLPYEIVTGIVKPNVEIWEHLMQQMPIFALVRHLNTLEEAGVFNKKENISFVVGKLTNPEIIAKSRMLPFRFTTAYDNFKGNNAIRNALKVCLDLSLSNVDMLPGKNAFFLDVSGSMSGDYLKIGSLLGLAALKKSSDSTFLAFGSDLKYPKVDVNDTVMTNMDRCKDVFGGGTNTGMCIDYLLGRLKDSVNDWNGGGYHKQFPVSEKTTAPVNVDNIIIFTDEQQNAGSPVVKLFREYRMKVNKNAKLFIVDVAPYQARLANQDEPGVTFIYGWNDTVLDVLGYAMRGSGSHVEQIKKMK